MSELNFELLQENIRNLMKKNDITQQELAEIAGMSQANVSKALNPGEKKKFTVDQIFRIAQHFSVSIDDLTGNRAANEARTSPQSVLSFITTLLCEIKMRSTSVEIEEEVYEQYYNQHGYPDCKPEMRKISYPAFYFPDYTSVWDHAKDEHEAEDNYHEFLWCGNDSAFKHLNRVLKDFLPIVTFYLEGKMPEEAFNMILNGYLEKLAGE